MTPEKQLEGHQSHRMSARQNSKSQAVALFHLRRHPTQSHSSVKWVALPWQLPKVPPYTINRCLFYNRTYYLDSESKQLSLIHRNTHREAAKMRSKRNMAQRKEQKKRK